MGKKKVYSDEQIQYVVDLVNRGTSVTGATIKMCEKFEITYKESIGRQFRHKLQKAGVTKNTPSVEDTDVFKEAQQKQHDSTKNRFLISWAQSETPVHKAFLKNMEAYARHIDGDILICAGRYKSPTSLASSKQLKKKEKDVKNTWDPLVLPYLDANRHNLHPLLCILSNIKIQPTSSMPLNGLNSITGLESCIIGHPRVQLRSLPVVEGYPHKLLMTTGAVTVENYTDSAVGAKGAFHHQIACVIVEIDGESFHLRHITADKKGDFYDLVYQVKDGQVNVSNEPTEAMVFGDLHIGETNPIAEKVSFQMAEVLRPKKIIIHDPVNSHSVSHHELKDPFLLLKREEDGSWSLERELNQAVSWFKKYPQYQFVTVRSNHCEHIDKWLCSADWRKSTNKKMYLKFANVLAEGKAQKGIVPYVFSTELDNVYPLGIDESLDVKGWQLGIHSHLGVHGSRSSPTQLKNLPIRTIVGHSHVPNRIDGSVSVGTLTHLRVGYNKGASGWLNSNAVIYPDGKVAQLNIINGRFTTLLD